MIFEFTIYWGWGEIQKMSLFSRDPFFCFSCLNPQLLLMKPLETLEQSGLSQWKTKKLSEYKQINIDFHLIINKEGISFDVSCE